MFTFNVKHNCNRVDDESLPYQLIGNKASRKLCKCIKVNVLTSSRRFKEILMNRLIPQTQNVIDYMNFAI